MKKKKTVRNQIALSSLLVKYRYCSANTTYLDLVSSVSSEFLKKQQGFFTIKIFSLPKFIKLAEISCCCHVAGPRATAPLAEESKASENHEQSRAAFSSVGESEAEITCYLPFR